MPTAATPISLGTLAPAFTLGDVSTGSPVSLDTVLTPQTAGALVLFLCVHCPYVKHVEAVLTQLAAEFAHVIPFVAISSNDPEHYPEDGPEGMRAQAARCGWTFPYLFDQSQHVARAFDAACTPESYLFDRDRRLVYHGRIDATRPARKPGDPVTPATGDDLRAALQALINGPPPLPNQPPSLGCSIKWRSSPAL